MLEVKDKSITKEEKQEALMAIAHVVIKITGALNNVIVEDTDMDEEAVKHLAESIEALSEGAIQFAKARIGDELSGQLDG